MSTTAFDASPAHAADHADHKPQGFLDRWVFTTNHKDIGTLYLVFSFVMFCIGGSMSGVIRAELAQPGLQFVHPERSEEHTSELQSLMSISYAVFCLKKKNKRTI